MKIHLFILAGIITATCASNNLSDNKGSVKDLVSTGKNVFFKDAIFNEDIDFTQYAERNLISEGVYMVQIPSSITFQNCTFNGKVISYKKNEDNTVTLTAFQSNLSFIACNFEDEVSFRAASVMGRADYTNAAFSKHVSFEECTFFQNAYFRASNYHEEARFQNTVFMQKANFLKAEFDVTSSFQNAVFHSEAQFSSVTFNGYADFGLVNCFGNFFANYSIFSNQAIFNNSFYLGQADFLNIHFNKCEMKNCRFFGQSRFSNSTSDEGISLENSFFLNGLPEFGSFQKEKINLEGCKSGS